ncbi:amino acid adenylation domain-containing protein [Enterobacter sp. ECC-019]|uniref:amino acid adenylation domain-containing protein n=1 Tax=Enterobacter sp. ECC-019 TaxID=3116478 RepID=UPI0037546DBD
MNSNCNETEYACDVSFMGESRSCNMRDGFVKSKNINPHAIAMCIGKQNYSYEYVDDLARRWASVIVDGAQSENSRVAILGDRNIVSYVGILATLYAGACFVPLNKNFPNERTSRMLAQANVDSVIVESALLPKLLEILEGHAKWPNIIVPDGDVSVGSYKVFDKRLINRKSKLEKLVNVEEDAIAYLLFTSGSTGQPKGVPITHKNARAFFEVNQKRYKLVPSDRLSQTFEQTFDLSLFDVFMAWEAGAAFCAIKPIQLLSPFNYIKENAITVWFSVPSVAALLIKKNLLMPDSMPGLRWSLFCGEALPGSIAEAWKKAAPNSIVENLYGPTELTIACSVYRMTANNSHEYDLNQDTVPIGKFYDGISSIILDQHGKIVLDGECGELCVGGDQMFPGYWKNKELDCEKFIFYRDINNEYKRYYRTGDIVKRLPDGNHIYIGRMDQQVKVDGYRVELGEVETALRRAGCVEAAAFTLAQKGNSHSLHAAVTGCVDKMDIIADMRKNLPAYMIPKSIEILDCMPLNANGKIDRVSLRNLFIENRALQELEII